MDLDLVERAMHWIIESPAGGHAYGCRGTTHLPVEAREPCNCGRDKLVADLAAAIAMPSAEPNGHAA